jgi:hypothetical protein
LYEIVLSESIEVGVTDPDGAELSFSSNLASLPETSALSSEENAHARSVEASNYNPSPEGSLDYATTY